jgi:outer membrane protein OmpA-like peptidoglycan-associated protein
MWLLLCLGLLLTPVPATALTLVLATDLDVTPGECRGVLSATAAAPTDVALEGLAARDLRQGRDLPIQTSVQARVSAEPVALLTLALQGRCSDIRVSLASLSCAGGPCAKAAWPEVFGFSGLRLPPATPDLLAATVTAAAPVSMRDFFAAMTPPGDAPPHLPSTQATVFATASRPPPAAAPGIAPTPAPTAAALPRLEPDTDRPGGDLAHGEPLASGGPPACLARCEAEPACLGFTFVPEGAGSEAGACWLKAELNEPNANPGMTSGVVRLTAAPPREAPAPAASVAEAPPGVSPEFALPFQRVEGGPEGRLVIRVGDVDNLGHGWAPGHDPFSGRRTDPHPWPFTPAPTDPAGTDRIMLGSGVADPTATNGGDGYHSALDRAQTRPEAVVIPLEALPGGVSRVFLQLFVDDFQAPSKSSLFQVTLNGRRMPEMERMLNELDQTGPVGELLTLLLPPEHHDLLATGRLELLIDDPTTGAGDGYALDFVRLVLDPALPVHATLRVLVQDYEHHTPIPGATLQALDLSATADAEGRAALTPLPGGRVGISAAAAGYLPEVALAELVIGEAAELTIRLKRDASAAAPAPAPAQTASADPESDTALRTALQRDGRVVLRGIRFDTDSAIPRADSLPTLEALARLIAASGEDRRWLIEGHTDSSGGAAHNRRLSARRAQAVVEWLAGAGIPPDRLLAVGHGPDRPVASNASLDGRALNRRVEAAPLP